MTKLGECRAGDVVIFRPMGNATGDTAFYRVQTHSEAALMVPLRPVMHVEGTFVDSCSGHMIHRDKDAQVFLVEERSDNRPVT